MQEQSKQAAGWAPTFSLGERKRKNPWEADNESLGDSPERERYSGKWPQKVICYLLGSPAAAMHGPATKQHPRDFRNSTNRDTAAHVPDWPLGGSHVKVKTTLWRIGKQKGQQNQHAQKLERQELGPNPKPTEVYTKISMFSTGCKQDPESHNTIFKISRMQSKITGPMKHQKTSTSRRKRQSTKANEMVRL